MFGNVGKGQKDINPLLAAEKAKNAVVKTYRIDRINKATELEGRTNLPYQNHLVKVNFMPEGEPILDENGEPKDLRYTPSYEDSQVRMPEAQRAMPEGVSPEDLNPVANKQEAQGLWADGKRMFALNEMDEKLTPITSKAMLDSYSADAIGWMEPQETSAVEQTGQMRFLPEPVEKLSAFKGKRVQVLTSDLSLVGDVKYGDYTASFKGGPGYLDNDGWAFTDKAAADAFVTRWKKDGEPLIGLASLGSANHLNSLDARKAYAEKWKYLVSTGEISEGLANDHIKQAMKRIINSNSKNVKTDWRNAAKMIESADDLSNYFNKIPWAAAPMFYSKLTAKTLPIKYKKLVELGLDLETAAKEYRQPEFEGAELGDLYAIAEYDGSTPEHKPELNKAYPWRIKFKKKATLSEMHNVAKLTTDPRAFAKKKVGGRLGAQPLMVTGINLDKLLTGDITGSAKPLILREGTQKTKSNRAKQFGSGNPEAYRSYQQIQAERNTKKPKKKSTAKGDASAIANAAKLK